MPLLYLVCGLAFVQDLLRDNTLAFGIIYTPLVATAVFHKGHAGVWVLCAAACVLVVVGAFFPVVNSDLPDLIANRVLSVVAIVATAAFVQHARDTQDRLAAQTRRAEAAEQIKTQVLTNLSQDIRTPLHALLGVLTLTMADAKPAQREALGRVRSDGRELLATIDNLIDLTQLDEHEFERQTIDVAMIARDAAERAGATAGERQVTIAMNAERGAGEANAVGDSWAMRRILDNLLANAVRFSPPGGLVSIVVNRSAGMVTASVSDAGRGLPPGLTDNFSDDAGSGARSALAVTGGTGLALSSRLAQAMNGKLTAQNQPGSGAMVSLSLPAVQSLIA